MTDWMSPLPRTTIGKATFFVDEERPVALVRREAFPDLFLTWPELDVGLFAPHVSVHSASDALWVVYASDDDGGEDQYPALRASSQVLAVRVGTDGSLGHVRAEGVSVVGATRAGLWTSDSMGEEIDDGYRGDDLPRDWAAPTRLHIHLPGRPTRTLEVDRHVNAVQEGDRGHVLFVNPSPPVAHRDGVGINYEYRCAALTLGAVDQWPARVRFRDYVAEGWGTPVAPERLGWYYNPWATGHDPARIDLSAVAGTRWKRVTLTDAQKTQAVSALADQFATADSYWRAADGTISPLAEGVHETRVGVLGEWPQTVVQVTCRHPYFPAGRIRRSMRVFDDAGRIKFDRYAGLEFMEDLDTNALPDIREARDGILEV